MVYETKKGKKTFYYNVSYDIDMLREILEQLKDYRFSKIGHSQIAGYFTNFPATDKIVKGRVISFFNAHNPEHSNQILPDTIKRHTEDNNDYITYDYQYDELPDLYHYLDIIVNGKSVKDYASLFKHDKELNMFYVAGHADQLIMDGIMNYVNSPQLVSNGTEEENAKYDYKGLRELYRKTLDCFKFHLFAVKEQVETHEVVSGTYINELTR